MVKGRVERKKPGLFPGKLAQGLGPERKLRLTIEGRKRFVSKFGLTESKLGLASERLSRWKVDNCGGYAPLFCALRNKFGSLKGKEILEIGSSTAQFATVLKKIGAKPVVMDRVGVNERAPVEGHQGEFEDVGHLFKGRNFDAVISNWAFGNYRANNKLALEGIHSSLKPGGYLIVSNDRPSDITRKNLETAGFKVLLHASSLGSTYGLQDMPSGSSIFIAQKPK